MSDQKKENDEQPNTPYTVLKPLSVEEYKHIIEHFEAGNIPLVLSGVLSPHNTNHLHIISKVLAFMIELDKEVKELVDLSAPKGNHLPDLERKFKVNTADPVDIITSLQESTLPLFQYALIHKDPEINQIAMDILAKIGDLALYLNKEKKNDQPITVLPLDQLCTLTDGSDSAVIVKNVIEESAFQGTEEEVSNFPKENSNVITPAIHEEKKVEVEVKEPIEEDKAEVTLKTTITKQIEQTKKNLDEQIEEYLIEEIEEIEEPMVEGFIEEIEPFGKKASGFDDLDEI